MTPGIVVALLHNTALLLALLVVLDLLTRGVRIERPMAQALAGGVLGLIAIGIMSSPFVLVPGIIFDTRSVLLSLSGLFLGAIPTVIAMLIAALYRLLQGGAAAWTGVSVIVASGLIGIAWAQLRRGSLPHIGVVELYLLGLVVHMVMLALMFTLPWETALTVVAAIGLPVAIIFPLATMALGMLLAHRINRQRATDALEKSEARFRQLFEHVDSIAVQVYGPDQRVRYWNRASEKLYGFSRDEAVGRRLEDLIIPVELRDQVTRRVEEWTRQGVTPFGEELVLQDRDGRPVHVFSSHAMLENPAGERELFCIDIDITALRRAEDQLRRSTEELEFRSQHDALTGLPNRVLLRDRLDFALRRARRRGGCVIVMVVDLDRFKTLNDTLGHTLGDEMLRRVGARIGANVRGSDTLARIGGDEFVVVLEEQESKRQAISVAGKLLEAFRKSFFLDHRELFVTVSIGIALFPGDGESVEGLLKNAELAMYRAKALGRNTYQFYQEEMSAGALHRLTLENALRGAMIRQEWTLHYQPLVDLDTGALDGVEALLRWRHPEQGLIPPGQFIAVAEEMGLIGEIGNWVLEAACRQMLDWDAQGVRIPRVSVNLSVVQLERSPLLQQVQRVLGQTGLAPDRIEFEVTESMIMREATKAVEVLRSLQALGCTIAVDDFGTGYSSLGYLKSLPVNRLKIDRSFVRDIGRSASDEAIVQATIALGHSLGLKIVAEGVELERHRQFLRQHGCDVGQGYWFGRPSPADEILCLARSDTGS